MRTNIETVVERACRDKSMPTICRYTAPEVTKAIKELVALLEKKGTSDTRINYAVSCFARVLPKYAHQSDEALKKAVQQYGSAIETLTKYNLIRFLESEKDYIAQFNDPHPAIIESRAFNYRTDIDRASLNSGRPSFPKRETPNRTREEMKPLQEQVYKYLEDSVE